MTADDDLTGQLVRQLRDQVDGMTRAPVTLDAVKGTATGIRRRRAAAVGAGALAVIALVVPMALAGGSLDRADRTPGPTTEGPVQLGTVVLDPEAPQGAAPAVPYIDGSTLVDGDRRIELDADYASVARAGDEYVVSGGYGDPYPPLAVLSADGEVLESGFSPQAAAGSADGTVAAWVTSEGEVRARFGGATSVLGSADPRDGFNVRAVEVLGSGSCGSGADERCVVVVDTAEGEPETLVTQGGPASVQGLLDVGAVSADGLVAGRLSDDDDVMAPACSAVRTLDREELFETCDWVFGYQAGFSPDGSLLVGAPSDQDVLRSVAVLDARTGEVLGEIEVEGARTDGRVSIVETAWDADGSLLVKTERSGGRECVGVCGGRTDGSVYDLYRLTLDGEVERVLGPSEPGGGGNQPYLIGE